jgi:hypothetical protein
VDELFSLPYVNIGRAQSCLNVTYRSAQLNVLKLEAAGILKEIPGRKYNRIFVASEILKILETPEAKQSGN